MKKTVWSIVIICLFVITSTACNLLEPPPQETIKPYSKITDGPPKQKTPIELATKTPQQPAFTETRMPTATQVETTLPTVVPSSTPEPQYETIELGPGMYFEYDAQVWLPRGSIDNPYLQSREYSQCQIYLNNGHGMPDTLEVVVETINFANKEFLVSTWKYIGTKDVVLRGYTWDDSYFMSLENPNFEVIHPQCLTDFENIIKRYAETQSTNASAINAETDLPPIVYAKDANIYAYFTETGKKWQVTTDGSDGENDVYWRYQNPHVSPDGRFVAYEFFEDQSVFVFSFETSQLWPVKKETQENYSADTIIGWDSNNRLYISRVIGVCSSMPGTPQEPYQSLVFRFDVSQKSLTKVTNLPVSGNDPQLFSRGYAVSPSGRFFSFYTGGCNYGGNQKTSIFDLEKDETITFGVEGVKRLSNAEDRLVYFSADKFAQDKNVYAVVWDLYADGAQGLDIFEERGAIWNNPHWSYDDSYLILSQNMIPDTTVTDYSELYWWELYETELVLVDSLDGKPSAINLTEGLANQSDWFFGAWSPSDYRMVLINRPGRSHFDDAYLDELWLYDLRTDRLLLIDTGRNIESADW